MKILTSRVYVSKVHSEMQSNIAGFVKSDEHLVAVGGNIAKALGLPATMTVALAPGDKLHALPVASSKLNAEQRLAMEKAAVTFGSATLPLLKKYVPGLTGPIEGIDVVFATKNAFDAWADPERQSVVKPLVKTARVLVELVDVAELAVPTLKQVPYLDAVGVFVKVGDSVVQLWADVSKAVRSSASK